MSEEKTLFKLQIQKILRTQDNINCKLPLMSQLGIDSLDMIDLIIAIEDYFNLNLNHNLMLQNLTIDDLYREITNNRIIF